MAFNLSFYFSAPFVPTLCVASSAFESFAVLSGERFILLLAPLPLWRCGNIHLWQSLLRFCLLLFLPLNTSYKSASGHSYFLWYPFSWVSSAWEFGLLEYNAFAERVAVTKLCLQELPLTMRSVGSGLCLCLQSYWFPTEQPIFLELPGEQWPRGEVWPLLPPTSVA